MGVLFFAGFDLFSTKLAYFESSPDLSQPSFMKKEQMKSTPVYEIAIGVSELCVHYIWAPENIGLAATPWVIKKMFLFNPLN